MTNDANWRPFPVETLPEPVCGFVTAAAAAIGCDPSYIAMPTLAGLAGAIGNARRIRLKRSWTEPAILWAVIVGDSGTSKSPALEIALKPIRERQRKALAELPAAVAEYQADLMLYERDLAQWKRAKAGGEPPEPPPEPKPARCLVDDPTVEKVAALLEANPRGLLLARDELAGWLTSFDRYAKSGGGDVAKWLEMHAGRSLIIDRKTTTPPTLYIPRASVSICGGIQPQVLRRRMGPAYRENGLAARLLLAYPPRRPKRWSERDIDPETERAMETIIERLYDLEPELDNDGTPRPALVRLEPDAKRRWVRFYDAHADETAALAGDLAAAWSKLEAYCARLALIHHLARWVAGDPTLRDPDAVDLESVDAAVELTRWLAAEARRVYGMIAEPDEDREQGDLVETIQRAGGSVTPRDLQRHSRSYRAVAQAEEALSDLVKAGIGTWQTDAPGAQGGRPARRFVLAPVDKTPVLVDTTPEFPEEKGVVSALSSVNALFDEAAAVDSE